MVYCVKQRFYPPTPPPTSHRGGTNPSEWMRLVYCLRQRLTHSPSTPPVLGHLTSVLRVLFVFLDSSRKPLESGSRLRKVFYRIAFKRKRPRRGDGDGRPRRRHSQRRGVGTFCWERGVAWGGASCGFGICCFGPVLWFWASGLGFLLRVSGFCVGISLAANFNPSSQNTSRTPSCLPAHPLLKHHRTQAPTGLCRSCLRSQKAVWGLGFSVFGNWEDCSISFEVIV